MVDLSSLVSSEREIHKAMQRYVAPRIRLREKFLKPTRDRLRDHLEFLKSSETKEVTYPGAEEEVINAVRSVDLNPSALFISDPTSGPEDEKARLTLLGVTTKMLKRLNFDSGRAFVEFFNDTLSEHLSKRLSGSTSDADELERFVESAHYAAGGAAWDGDCRNLAGRMTTAMFQRQLVNVIQGSGLEWKGKRKGKKKKYPYFEKSSYSAEKIDPMDGDSLIKTIEVPSSEKLIHFGEPDVKVVADNGEGEVLLAGEIKGRTDLSNLYESWITTVKEKLENLRGKHRGAIRVAYQLFITEEMLCDPERSEDGFADMVENGLADSVHSLIKNEVSEDHRTEFADEIRDIIC